MTLQVIQGRTGKSINGDVIQMDPIIGLDIAKGKAKFKPSYKEKRHINKALNLRIIYRDFMFFISFIRK